GTFKFVTLLELQSDRPALEKEQTLKVIAELRHDADVGAAAFSPDGKWLFTATKLVPQVSLPLLQVWDVAERKVASSLTCTWGEVRTIAFTPDGAGVIVVGSKQTMLVPLSSDGRLGKEKQLDLPRDTRTVVIVKKPRPPFVLYGIKGSSSLYATRV